MPNNVKNDRDDARMTDHEGIAEDVITSSIPSLDLQVVVSALHRMIDICNVESEMMRSRFRINANELNELHHEKNNLMNFLEWHISSIGLYISNHISMLKNEMLTGRFMELFVRMEAIEQLLIHEVQSSDTATQRDFITSYKQGIHNITASQNKTDQNKIVKIDTQISFTNHTDEMPIIVVNLLKEFMLALEYNFHSVMCRKKLNNTMLSIMTTTVADQQKNHTYNPKTKKQGIYSKNAHVLLNEDC